MKKLFIILLIGTPFFSKAQLDFVKNFSIGIKGAHYNGRYTDNAIGNEFFENYFFQGEVNYKLHDAFAIGGFYAIGRGREKVFISYIRDKETGAIIGTRGGSYYRDIHILGTNFQYCFPTIYIKNILGVDEINFYAAVELGYMLYAQLKSESVPTQDDGWMYNIGTGINFQMGPRFFLNTEFIWDRQALIRFGFGWRIGKLAKAE